MKREQITGCMRHLLCLSCNHALVDSRASSAIAGARQLERVPADNEAFKQAQLQNQVGFQSKDRFGKLKSQPVCIPRDAALVSLIRTSGSGALASFQPTAKSL